MAILLVGGGSRSGKSRQALELARRYGPRRGFLATAQAFDDEMRDRIQMHRDERGDEFVTWEDPMDLAGSVRRAEGHFDVLIVDCLTLWLTNWVLADKEPPMTETLDAVAASPLRRAGPHGVPLCARLAHQCGKRLEMLRIAHPADQQSLDRAITPELHTVLDSVQRAT